MPNLFDQLLGSWDLVSYQLELDGGRTAHPLGEQASGLIVYTPQRRMSVNIMRPGRAAWASPNPAAGTSARCLAVCGSFQPLRPGGEPGRGLIGALQQEES
jgi:Lipocalin-like domain